MSAFEVVAVVVSLVAIALAATSYFRLNRVLSELGRQGPWFDHAEDHEITDQPNEDDRDEPIPKRHLRGRDA
jgi:hypothetical protein